MKKITFVVPLGKNRESDFLDTYQKDRRTEIIVIEGDNPSKNRNTGIKKSKTDLIAFDEDIVI